MKTFLTCLLLFCFLIPASANEPVYLDDFWGFLGSYVFEFALNGDKEMIREVEPFVQNNRLYFIGIGIPMSTGNLRPDFEFNLDFFISGTSPRIKAMYRGTSRIPITKGYIEDVENGVIVSGYAERGSIIITHAFSSLEEAERWAANVRLASRE